MFHAHTNSTKELLNTTNENGNLNESLSETKIALNQANDDLKVCKSNLDKVHGLHTASNTQLLKKREETGKLNDSLSKTKIALNKAKEYALIGNLVAYNITFGERDNFLCFPLSEIDYIVNLLILRFEEYKEKNEMCVAPLLFPLEKRVSDSQIVDKMKKERKFIIKVQANTSLYIYFTNCVMRKLKDIALFPSFIKFADQFIFDYCHYTACLNAHILNNSNINEVESEEIQKDMEDKNNCTEIDSSKDDDNSDDKEEEQEDKKATNDDTEINDNSKESDSIIAIKEDSSPSSSMILSKVNKLWDGLTKEQKNHAQILGYNKKTWNLGAAVSSHKLS